MTRARLATTHTTWFKRLLLGCGMLVGSVWSLPVLAAPPQVLITEPTDGQTLTSSPITVRGRVNDATVSEVTIAVRVFVFPGRPLIIDQHIVPVTNGKFNAQLLMDLREGANQINVKATNAQGETGRASINVTLDTIAPVTTITWPQDGDVIGPNSQP